jgi:hypothetical protein
MYRVLQDESDSSPEVSDLQSSLVSSFGRDAGDESEEYLLRCYSFPEKKEKLRFSIPLHVAMRQYLRLTTGLSTLSTAQTSAHHTSSSHSNLLAAAATAAVLGAPPPPATPVQHVPPPAFASSRSVSGLLHSAEAQAPFQVNTYNGLYHRAVPPTAQFFTFVALSGVC